MAANGTEIDSLSNLAAGTVLDVGGHSVQESFRTMLRERLGSKKPGERKLFPSALLSDDAGLAMWRDVTRLPGYYATAEEIRLLEDCGGRIAEAVEPGSVIIDLGCGDVRKIIPVLDSLERAGKQASYLALDLSRPSLEQNMAQLIPRYRHVRCFGLHGTFEDGLAWSRTVESPRWFLSLGSIFGNDAFDDAVGLLQKWSKRMRPHDRMLLGIDAERDEQRVWESYNDPDGVVHRFLRNAFAHSNRVLESTWYRDEDWTVTGKISIEKDTIVHRCMFKPVYDVDCDPLNTRFAVGDHIDFYESYKWGPAIMKDMFARAGFDVKDSWNLPDGPIHEYLLQPA
ncbi:uncharacterized protein BKCO1_27000115 [Diplodia corticola]|uniref:4-dimethylallyltryptophan N-methyltransferase n=1 Tax=Diplodia corticola TaxID=236234 RepID=A0A1J9QXM9_9PEZI|nr:uncharacterized protein BKCO1_27000115 [Diplodia corticola]OJD33790.1 hypothetical protein BKCO1_27000115 [Diplodia corticola]